MTSAAGERPKEIVVPAQTTTRIERPSARPRTPFGTLVALGGVFVGVLYLVFPTFGVFELIPDNIPFIGNLDEAGATTMLVFGLQYLFGRRRD